MTLNAIRLELARGKEFPEGSQAHGYEFVAPLDASGHFDAAEWKQAHDKCVVRRFWASTRVTLPPSCATSRPLTIRPLAVTAAYCRYGVRTTAPGSTMLAKSAVVSPRAVPVKSGPISAPSPNSR